MKLCQKGECMLDNVIKIELESNPANEKIARQMVSSIIVDLNPTIEEMCDIKTAVSEAVTNSIIHGYKNTKGTIYITTRVKDTEITIEIADKGIDVNVDFVK